VQQRGPMDSEIERFRIDPQVRDQAAEVCARFGLELNDVLRVFVTRIATEGAIPIELPPDRGSNEDAPFGDNNRLWSSLRTHVEAEVAIALLARFVADCSTTIDELADLTQTDSDVVARLNVEREEARQLRNTLDVTDASAVRAVLHKYGPLVRGRST
jgi:addiction module RelB/DinJ family antitoxin